MGYTVESFAAECRWMQGEVLHIEKVDENPNVRHQAGVALDADAGTRPAKFV